MNCKEIQDLIITDYIDAQMEDKLKRLIDQHLVHCHACKEFLISIEKEVINPFNSVHKAIPDGFLWVRIKQAIEERQEQKVEKVLMPGFWERLRSAVHIPKPAFALATLITMIFMVGVTDQLFLNTQPVKINGQDQMEYLSSLLNGPADFDTNNGNGSQTPIEKYFL